MSRAARILLVLPILATGLGGSAAEAFTLDGVERASILVEVTPADKAQLKALRSSGLDVFHAHGRTLDIRVTPTQYGELLAGGYPTRVVDEDVYDGLRGGSFLPEYLTFAEIQTALNDFATNYPTLTELSVIGQSLEGRDIYALKISDNAGVDENEPEILVNSLHHSREVITPIITLALADSLLSNYGTDPTFTQWVDTRELWIVPCLNPDGYVHVETTDIWWRKNRRPPDGVDLNRNYDYQWGHDDNGSSGSQFSETYRGASPASEPEIQAITAFVNSRNFVYSLSYHSSGNLLLHGPSWYPALHEDHDIHQGYGDLVAAENNYEIGNPATGTIYTVNGGSDDWMHYAAGHAPIWAFTPEVGTGNDGFHPSASRIPTLVDEGLECTWPAFVHVERPEQVAPPGPVTMNAIPASGTGSYDVTWNAPTVADTEVVNYRIFEKTGPAVITEDFESGNPHHKPGGWSQSSNRSSSGSFSFYSGQGDEFNRICHTKEPYAVQAGDMLTFNAWWDIEDEWDYAYVLLSTDGGRSFENLPGSFTTMNDPNGNNADHGITGSSSGWQAMTFDLSNWVGDQVWIGFRYYTDSFVQEEGIYVDDVAYVQTFASSTILSSSVVTTSYSVSGRPNGTYYYMVRGFDAEGDIGYRSDVSSVVVDLASAAPAIGNGSAFTLAANRPNPFEERTSIRFSLPAAGSHSLTVFDVAGRRVRTLSGGHRSAGAHEVIWDGRNDSGNRVPSGVYFYTLRSSSGELRERAVLRR